MSALSRECFFTQSPGIKNLGAKRSPHSHLSGRSQVWYLPLPCSQSYVELFDVLEEVVAEPCGKRGP